ncbi:MAG: NADH-quinone oxidoreductase subunit C [Gammaproteobacteria bacterium]|nr:MAG: NADH-quinone oxidoreductase subunit C [Gammaproteobacteria bacterium]
MSWSGFVNIIEKHFGDKASNIAVAYDEITIEVPCATLREVALVLRDHDDFRFEQLIDLCGIDYSAYGVADWETHAATEHGFERAVMPAAERHAVRQGPRFASVVHLLSIVHNRRIRVRTFAEDDEFPVVPSLVDIWASANWYEREAFDLFGIMYEGHPDLRRILTDYGFVGHPFRKDFPLIGHVEMRYDAAERRCVYEKVSIEPRVLVPRVIREETRFGAASKEEQNDG